MRYTAKVAVQGPVILRERSRLDEIYRLRVIAWEKSPDCDMVNTTLYPNGWSDSLDDTAVHWVILNQDSEIISSARLNRIQDIEELLPLRDYSDKQIEISSPFAYISRLVTHPDYRSLGLSRLMDEARIRFALSESLNTVAVLAGDLGIGRFEKLGFIEQLKFLNKAYLVNPRKAHSHLMTLDLSHTSPIREHSS